MIHTCLADVSALYEETVYRKYYEQVPEFRKEKADHLRRVEDKALSIGAWILLQKMEEEYHLQGKYVYNLSHSGKYAMCIVDTSGNESALVGCDIERIGKARPGMAERYFCPEEQELIQTTDDFYRHWVLKESFMKAIRKGSNLALNAFGVAFTKENLPYIYKQPQEFPQNYYYKEYSMREYKIAVCADSDAFAEEIKMIEL